MKHRGAFTVFSAAFAVVLLGGLALAQVGALSPGTSSTEETPVDTVAAVAAAEASQAVAATTVADDSGDKGAGDGESKPESTEPEGSGDDDTKEDPDSGAGDGDDGEKGDDGDDDGEGGDDEKGDDPDTTPPRIEILHPEDGQVFHEKTITFEGKTEPGAKVTAGRYEADVNDDGVWRIKLVLSEGRNLARFTATDAAGNSAEATVTVVYEPKKEEPPRVEFSAHQKYGSSSANPPYDVFYGTATPGAKIWVGSEYGDASTTANSHGNWEVKVKFPEAPVKKAIRVVVESNDGGRKVFEFVNKGNDEGRHEFTANQTYGSCGEEIPYDVFYGRADAGERIWVESPYGSGVTEANADGHWEIKVKFPEAPPGKVFEVVVEAKHGGRKVFTFVNTGGEH
ncbi:MAG: hypothetical protein GY720_10935 [bacterium]|nr:hypothetical protein [bacterium]